MSEQVLLPTAMPGVEVSVPAGGLDTSTNMTIAILSGGQQVGNFDLFPSETGTEITCDVDEEHRRHGIATAAARILVGYLVGRVPLPIFVIIQDNNDASRAIAAKFGLHPEPQTDAEKLVNARRYLVPLAL